MRDLFQVLPFSGPVWQADGGAGAAPAPAADDPPPAAGAAPAANPPAANDPAAGAPAQAAAKWFEAESLAPDDRKWLESKGLTGIEDPAEAAVKVAKFYREAEKMIGDKNAIRGPAKDQALSEWMKANGKTFGLPETADGYKVDKPQDWPNDLPWNDELDAKARELAHQNGVPPELHKAYVGLIADYMKGTAASIEQELAQANQQMMTELQAEWGQQTPARITEAKQAAQHFAQEAGLSSEALTGVMSVLKEKVGDAATIRLFQAIGASMGEDRAVQIGKGGALGMTPAEAKAAMSAMSQKGGKLWEATKSGNRAAISEAQAEMERLARIVAGS